jgi:signal transduction histidine kinase
VSLRLKLLLVSTLLVLASVAAVAWVVTELARRAFERASEQHTAALVEQFQRDFSGRGDEVVRRVAAIADQESILRMAIDVSRAPADRALYVNEARALAAAHQLDFLDLVAPDGAIISSAGWPARFGYKEDWIVGDANQSGAFLARWELPESPAIALTSVAAVRVGGRSFYVAGGLALDRRFLASLVLPAGMRALLYLRLAPGFVPTDLLSASGFVDQPEKLAPLIARVEQGPRELRAELAWSSDPASRETFYALPLTGADHDLLAILLVGSSDRDRVLLERYIRLVSTLVAAGGILLGILLSWWAASWVSRPVEKLVAGARAVAAGKWETRVELDSGRGELSQLARAFNQMTAQLVEQRDRLVQAERVAAWRELARRLAHELKNPLFPLQITVENLERARDSSPEQFDEVFRESTRTLLAELENLKTILSRFGDFARMPAPVVEPVDVNELVRDALKLFEAQFRAPGRPAIDARLDLDETLAPIQADPGLLRRALENLILNAMDAMPAGGDLRVATRRKDSSAELVVSDTGQGLTPEERDRLFTPYYTSKQHGTGLGLAIVQSVVSDHGGKISVESEPGRGTTFRIELPARPPAGPSSASPGRASEQGTPAGGEAGRSAGPS